MDEKELLTQMFGSPSKNTTGLFLQHPNPKFQRSPFLALNGKYDFTYNTSYLIPSSYDSHIIVPFQINTKLSETNIKLKKKYFYHYHKIFTLNNNFDKTNVYLIIESFKGMMVLFINGKEAYKGIDGVNSRINIKKYINIGTNSLDFTFKAYKTNEIGIDGPILAEASEEKEIKSVDISVNLEKQLVNFKIDTLDYTGTIKITTPNGLNSTFDFSSNSFSVELNDFILWTPDNPFFYQYNIITKSDNIKGTFLINHFSLGTYKKINCFMLNNEPYPIRGLLDNYHYENSLYTMPSYEENNEIFSKVKLSGFNSLYLESRSELPFFFYNSELKGLLLTVKINYTNSKRFEDEITYLSKYQSIMTIIINNKDKKIKNSDIYNYAKTKTSSFIVVYNSKGQIGDIFIIKNFLDKLRLIFNSKKYYLLLKLSFKKDFGANFIKFMKEKYIKYSLKGLIGFYYSSINSPKDGIFSVDYKKRDHGSKAIMNYLKIK